MAQVQLQDDDRTYDPTITTPGVAGPRVGGSVYAGASGPIDVAPGVDVSDVERRLREAGGGLFDPSDLEGVLRNTGYNSGGVSLDQAIGNATSTYDQRRRNSTPGGGGGGGARGIGPLFDDPASAQLQGIAQAQMGEVRSNPGLDALMKFLNSQFSQLSTNPGYSPEDLAILNTQAFEPIEERRKADQRRVLERTAARGFLPSSGLTEDMSQQADTEANRQRTVAGRDLAINAIGQRRADLDKALQYGSLLGLDIPRSQRSEELALARIPYQMGRDSLADLLAVINGSPTSGDLFSQTLQANQQSLWNQQQNDARNEALLEEIGRILPRLFPK